MHAWLFPYHLDCTKIPGLWSDKKLTGRWGGPAQALAVFSLEAGRSPCGTPCPELAWALPCSTLYLCGSTAPHVGEKCSTTYFLPRNSRLYSVISLFTMSGFYSLNSNSRLWVSWKQPQESGRALSELGNFHFSPEEATIINSSTEEAEVWKWPPVPLLGITGGSIFMGIPTYFPVLESEIPQKSLMTEGSDMVWFSHCYGLNCFSPKYLWKI